jgi:predicted RNase H-like HicB family nuclease
MHHIQRVTAVIEREGDAYVALCPELDVASQGDTIEEARRNLQEALDLFLEAASPSEIADRFHREVYVTQLDVAFG